MQGIDQLAVSGHVSIELRSPEFRPGRWCAAPVTTRVPMPEASVNEDYRPSTSRWQRPRRKALDTWTWTAIDADTKLVMSWLVGGRDSEYAMGFIDDLSRRLANRVQLTSDGHRAYLEAVEGTFGGDIDYAMLIKLYGASPDSAKGRYSPAECTDARKEWIEGNPDIKHVSTSFAERQNLTMRMHMRRFTRLTNGFSKKVEAHANAVALHFMYYNFGRIHATLRLTPAMAAGVTGKLWEFGDIVALIEAKESEKPAVRGSYKKRAFA